MPKALQAIAKAIAGVRTEQIIEKAPPGVAEAEKVVEGAGAGSRVVKKAEKVDLPAPRPFSGRRTYEPRTGLTNSMAEKDGTDRFRTDGAIYVKW